MTYEPPSGNAGSEHGAPVSDAERPFAERVHDRRVGPCRLLTLQTPVRGVVSWRGSFKVYPDFAGGDELLQNLTVSLLDKGTRNRDRFAVAEILEDRGAQVRFGSDGLYVDFSGRALRDDLEEVLAIVAEQLIEPLFDPDEFAKARAQVAASLQRSMENTGSQASGALARRLYTPMHPNYSEEPAEQLRRLEALTVDDVRAYHARHFGASELTLALVGDVDGAGVERVVREGFEEWPPTAAEPRHEREARPRDPGESRVPMPDKQNVDVRIGHALGLYRQDADYVPLYLANYILGGNFSARLMAVIRDEMGLTYGIRSGFSGISTEYQGHWQVAVTLSQENVARGVEATLAEIRRFVEDGVTEEELRDKKTTITGSFKVGLSTTGGIAAALLRNVERGFGPDYLDRFPDLVEAATLSAVNDAVRRHFRPERLHVALAGMLPEAQSA